MSSFVVKIYDGSLDNDTQKVKSMPLTIYLDAQLAGSSSAEQPVSGKSICRKRQPVSGKSTIHL